jgi:hypothetical protein
VGHWTSPGSPYPPWVSVPGQILGTRIPALLVPGPPVVAPGRTPVLSCPVLFFFFFFAVLGFELRTFTLSHPAKPFSVRGFFKIGFQRLFAWTGLELRSS